MLKNTADIAQEAGFSESSAHKYKQVARDLVPEVKEVIRTTKLADSTTELLRLARMDLEAVLAAEELEARQDGVREAA